MLYFVQTQPSKSLFETKIIIYWIIGSNPCDEGKYFFLHNGGFRATECSRFVPKAISHKKGHKQQCKIKLSIKCFTLSETQPTDDGTVVTTNVCMRDGSNTCKKQYQIQILKCGSFFLYNLSRPETHDTAYCFGKLFGVNVFV